MDGKYVRDVHNKFGNLKTIKSFPIMQIHTLIYYSLIRQIKFIDFLETIPFNKKKIMKLLEEKLDWEYYGGHHHDNNYTVFFQSEYLPNKFGIDKRLRELSALVLSKQMTREEALKILLKPYPIDLDLNRFVMNKLELSESDMEDIMQRPNKTFNDYSTYVELIYIFKYAIKFFCDNRVLPKTFYEKYFG